MEDKLVRNAIKTPDGTILESWDRHDYRTYIDTKDGEEYMVDGGLDYIRRSIGGEDLSVHLSDGHEAVRNAFSWGTYGKSGTEPFRRVLLKDMTTNHIKAVLETQTHIGEMVTFLMKEELNYRGE